MWIAVCKVDDVPGDGGACIKWGEKHIALFNVTSRDDWYAMDNRCPHDGQTVLARGIVGDAGGSPKVACPLHKNSFCLKDGRHLGGQDDWRLTTYPVKVEGGQVFIELPEEKHRGAS
ncbi:MAG TPA: nitrite reductase small subunit NirD [Oligoflexus sp.]|uniref:nitrite reductase small subunit NirD n=1 Tax=Oligoflexus sp. TaxID=1971216 RepID=UPI002D5769FC|nr:nitrite reductase small subunit NirD [Oligoflexus sp.]HYX35476.1 nitrite reductase small subunit NirD [Oligoflexus sp.]